MISVDPADDRIEEFLENNSLGRNAFLNGLLSIIESSNEGVILDVNGQWGSGKTVLAKEIEMLSTAGVSPDNIDVDAVSELKNNYSVFYYNAWENDQYNPAESMAFQLLNRFWGGSGEGCR